MYPWSHGAHSRGDLRFPTRVASLATILQRAGYATGCFSANRFIGPEFGFGQGFELSLWGGGWWGVRKHSFESSGGNGVQNYSAMLPNGSRRFLDIVANPLWSHPFPLDIVNRIYRSVRPVTNGHAIWSAPWLEKAVEQFVLSLPRERPMFTFVNLMDAHEPYLTEPSANGGLLSWLRYARLDQRKALAAPSQGGGEDAGEFLHSLYCERLRAIDGRLRTIADSLKRLDRWDETLLVLVSDHGQGFGEGGSRYHEPTVDDAVLRIPFWLKFPRGRWAGERGLGWASLVDVLPTVLDECGLVVPSVCDGIPIQTVRQQQRPGPVLAMADWIRPLPASASNTRSDGRRRLLPLVAFERQSKTIWDPLSGRVGRESEAGSEPVSSEASGEDSGAAVAALQEASKLLLLHDKGDSDSLTIDRLKSWGYG